MNQEYIQRRLANIDQELARLRPMAADNSQIAEVEIPALEEEMKHLKAGRTDFDRASAWRARFAAWTGISR